MNTPFSRASVGFVLGFSAAILVGLWLLSRDSAPQAHASPGISTPVEGLAAALDPETGALREPTLEEWTRLHAGAPKEAEAPAAGWKLHDGGVAMRAPAHMMSFSVVRIGPAGERSFGCVEGGEAAHAWVSGAESGCDGHAH